MADHAVRRIDVNTLKGHHTPAILRITLLLLALTLVGACGTFEIRVEMPGEAPTETPMLGMVTIEVVVTAERTPPQPLAKTPTPTPQDYDPWTAEPAFTPMPASDYLAPAGLHVAFVQDDQLWLWSAETKKALALASMSPTDGQVKVSGDGAVVAFLRGNDLWAIDSDGTMERQLLSVEDLDANEPNEPGVTPNRLKWVPGTHTLAFNTRLQMAHGLVLNDDMHLVDADTGQRSTLLPAGEGGEFYYSPDGSRIAVVTPGEISLVDANGEQLERVLTYTPVNTGSEYRFYARPFWSPAGSMLRVAIPPADPFVQPAAQTTIWHIAADGSPARLLTSVDAAPLLSSDSPAFSSDLEYVAYAQIRGAEGASPAQAEPWLEVQRLANGDRQAYPYASNLVRWAPDSQLFAFIAGRHEPRLYIGQWSGATVPGAVDAGTDVFDVRWVDAEHYLFVARSKAERGPAQDGWDLVLADIHGTSTILASMDSYPQYDFAIDPSAVPLAEPTRAVTPTPAAMGLTPERTPPTPTPVTTLPGLVYHTDDGLWLDRGGQRARLLDRHVAQLSPDGVHALYVAGDGDDRDLWLAVLPLSEQHNLTRAAERHEATPRWWAAQPEVVVFSSLPTVQPLVSGAIGYLTVVNMDGSDYRILDDQNYLNSPPAPAPDGKTIAYGSSSGGWLYRWDTELQPFDPADYGLNSDGEIELGSPAWSPDGTKLAWLLAGDLDSDGGFRRGVAVFDLNARTAQVLHVYAAPGGVWSPDGAWLAFEAWAATANEAGTWVVRADGQREEVVYLGGHHPVWSPNGYWLALSDPTPDKPGHWMANVGSWNLLALALPHDAQIVDWIDPSSDSDRVPAPASPVPCELSPLQVPMAIPWMPTPTMLCLEWDNPEDGQMARLLDYHTDASSVAPGDRVTLRWDADGGEMVLLEVYDMASVQHAQESYATSVPVVGLYDNLPLTGDHTVLMPEDLADGARIVLWVADRGPTGSPVAMYKRLAFAVIDLPRQDS
jgi:Tol biopolymer transport system component